MFGRERERDEKINLSNCTITTIIGNDTVVEGTIITKSSVRIDGTLIGGVSAEGVVILSKNGKIRGNIMAENIIVAGVVEGNMQIREKVNVEPTGEIYGDITTKKLLIDEESIFQGNCYMNRDVKQAGKGRKGDKTEEVLFEEVSQEVPAFSEEIALPKRAGKKLKATELDEADELDSADVLRETDAESAAKDTKTAANKAKKTGADDADLSEDIEDAENDTDLDADADDDDMDFLDVNVKKNRNTTNDNKRRRR